MIRGSYEHYDAAVPDILSLKITLWRYMLLSQLTAGEARNRYKEKQENLDCHIQNIENLYLTNAKRKAPFSWLFQKKHMAQMVDPPRDGINRNKREREIIVSLTTYPQRLGSVWIVLKKMLSQTYKPDKILLYLAETEFPGHTLPRWTEAYREAGVKFVFCKDLKSHKKYYYAMKEYPEAVVITVDDDLFYNDNMIEVLMKSYMQFPNAVSATRAFEMTFDNGGHILPYKQWDETCGRYIGEPTMRLLPIGSGGVLYPPHSLHQEVFNEENIIGSCLRADDLWLKLMAVLQGTQVVLAEGSRSLDVIDGTQETALWRSNVHEEGNDKQLKSILKLYNSYHGENDTVEQRIWKSINCCGKIEAVGK